MWTRLKRIDINISAGFLLLIGILFYLDDGIGMLPWGILAALLHELGHVGACVLFGGRVEALTLSVVGAELRFHYPLPLSYGRENIVALAGPTANVLLGISAMLLHAYIMAAASFGLGLLNLLPILPLDGGRVFSNLISERFGPMAADRVLAVAAGILIGVLVGIGAFMALNYANIMLLIVSVWLLFGSIRKKTNFSPNK